MLPWQRIAMVTSSKRRPPSAVLALALALTCPGWPLSASSQETARPDASALTGDEAASLAPPSRRTLQKARQHYDAGTSHYAAADYGAAMAEFQEAYRLSHLPDLLYNLGKVAEKMEDPAGAADYLRRYLTERPDAPDAPAIRGQVLQLDALVAARAAAAPSPSRVPWPALGLMAGGATVLLIGGGLSIGATQSSRAVIDRLQANPFDMTVQDLQDRSRALGSAGIALSAIGAVAVVAGVVWTGVWFGQRAKKTPLQVRVTPSSGALSFSF